MIFNTPATYYAPSVGFNQSGERTLAPGVAIAVGIVNLSLTSIDSNAKPGSTGSLGYAGEYQANGTGQMSSVVVKRSSKPQIGGKLVIGGSSWRIAERQERYAINGSLDHYEVGIRPWD